MSATPITQKKKSWETDFLLLWLSLNRRRHVTLAAVNASLYQAWLRLP